MTITTRKKLFIGGIATLALVPTRNKYGYHRPPAIIRLPATIAWVIRTRQGESLQDFWKEGWPGTNVWGWALLGWLGWENQYRTECEYPPG